MNGTIVIFQLPPKTNNTTLSKFCQKLYGQDTSSHQGKYKYHRHGLLDDIPHIKLIRGVIIIPTEHKEQVIELLKQHSAHYHTRTIKLTEEDCKALKLPTK